MAVVASVETYFQWILRIINDVVYQGERGNDTQHALYNLVSGHRKLAERGAKATTFRCQPKERNKSSVTCIQGVEVLELG